MIRSWTVAAVVATGVAGCAQQPKPQPRPLPPKPVPVSPAQQRSADVSAFAAALRQYDDHVAGLPGHTTADHRAAAAGATADLVTALRLAYVGSPPPAFATRVSVVDHATSTLAVDSVPRDRMAAAENEALDAATAALGDLADRVLYDDPQLPPLVAVATEKAQAARPQLGPLHDQDATVAYRAIGLALHRIEDDLRERFATVIPASAPAPMVMPASPSGMSPATRP